MEDPVPHQRARGPAWREREGAMGETVLDTVVQGKGNSRAIVAVRPTPLVTVSTHFLRPWPGLYPD